MNKKRASICGKIVSGKCMNISEAHFKSQDSALTPLDSHFQVSGSFSMVGTACSRTGSDGSVLERCGSLLSLQSLYSDNGHTAFLFLPKRLCLLHCLLLIFFLIAPGHGSSLRPSIIWSIYRMTSVNPPKEMSSS